MSDAPRQIEERRPRPKIGLVLGSGVARGWAHLGVLRGLGRLGIKPDFVCGTSMGAVVGGAYLCGRARALEDWALSLSKLKVISYLDLKLIGGGVIGGSKLIQRMEEEFGTVEIASLPVPFCAVATDLVTGHEVWLNSGKLVDALRASFGLPGVFPPFRHNDRWLVDGALTNPVPVSVCRAMGAQLVIAVNMHADFIGKARRPGQSYPTVAGFDLLSELEQMKNVDRGWRLDSFLGKVFGRQADAPSLFGTMVSALNILQDRVTRSRLAGDPPDVQITPRLGHMGLLEFHRAAEAIAEGEAAVERAMPDIRDSLVVFDLASR